MAFAFSCLVAGSGGNVFHPNVNRITAIVDNGANGHVVNEDLSMTAERH